MVSRAKGKTKTKKGIGSIFVGKVSEVVILDNVERTLRVGHI